MVVVKRYDQQNKTEWDRFVCESKMPMFMFERNYMDYHKDRFKDHSLMFYVKDRLIAVLPACEKDSVLLSHGGLTYGGFIVGEKMKQTLMMECFENLRKYASEHGMTRIIYKTIPFIFWNQASEEDQYALFRCDAKLIEVKASTSINLLMPFEMEKLRKRKVKKAQTENVLIRECNSKTDYELFIALLNDVLMKHHNVKAVHTSEELYMLHSQYPENIRLFVSEHENEMIAGTVVYEYESVVHTQYLASNDLGRKVGGLDFVIAGLIERYKGNKRWLDFGISTEDGGKVLNDGLISQKEGFGGRTVVYMEYSQANGHIF